jgi:hypothetical protein
MIGILCRHWEERNTIVKSDAVIQAWAGRARGRLLPFSTATTKHLLFQGWSAQHIKEVK